MALVLIRKTGWWEVFFSKKAAVPSLLGGPTLAATAPIDFHRRAYFDSTLAFVAAIC